MDLGCGAGRFVDLLADRCQQVLAVDASPRMVELARDRHDRPNITYRVEDLWRLTPAREGRFDVVLSVNTLHHLGPDPQAYLAHVRDLLNPGGRLVVIDSVQHTPGWVKGPVGYRAYRWTRTLSGAIRAGVTGRGLGVALASYQLRKHERWQELAAQAPALSRAQFHQEYRRAFPGAEFQDRLDPSVCGMSWTA
ncbi:SAM-dependent methyltransferase [Crossiella equi]|uniref:SAM-dependent methyltransferase n=2 Tax=Crossiella equi TaxID=130796 RepID=A0ABS5AQX0_9PSEU|nr:SAM-dependent methyltransferase [Crossiella equi]